MQKAQDNRGVRQAAVSSQFYPSDKIELSTMIDNFLSQATATNTAVPQILIVPHAGYVYSGRVAAFAFKQLQNSGFNRAIIIGRSHQEFFEGVAIDGSDAWQTPLGEVALDKDFISKLQKQDNSLFFENSAVHKTEHCLEVEVPFLQKVLGGDIKIVPMLFGDDNLQTVQKLADALFSIIDERTVVIISSDLAHYPSYDDANKIDKKTIDAILSDNINGFEQNMPNLQTTACAKNAIQTAMLLAKQMGLQGKLLKYANSGDAASQARERVVGYAALGFFSADARRSAPCKEKGTECLAEQEQKIALQIVRETLQAAFEKKDYPLSADLPKIFQENRGVFVTLKRGEQLRGCIGNFQPDISLGQNIKDMALSAGFSDSRFTPLQKDELKDIEIEISVLSALQKITDPNIIVAGEHGVMVRKGRQGGVYLPQVAAEMGWTREEFLNSLCSEKAGLARDCWLDGSAELFIFTAQVFSE